MENLFKNRPWSATFIFSIGGGIFLFFSNVPFNLWYFIWLVPSVFIILGYFCSRFQILVAALLLSVIGSLSLLKVIWSPVLIGMISLYWTILYLIILYIIRYFSRKLSPLLLVLILPCLLIILEYLMSFSPIGTALSWSYLVYQLLPLIQITELTGIYGITFIIGFIGSTLGLIAIHPKEILFWRKTVIISAVLFVIVLIYGIVKLHQPYSEEVIVAAVHAPTEMGRSESFQEIMDRVEAYRPLVKKCAAQGAKIVVWPEMTLSFSKNYQDSLMSLLSTLSIKEQIWQTIGFYDSIRNLNILRVFNPQGDFVGEYHKHHLVTLMEKSNPGNVPPLVVKTEFGVLGGLICNDDTFTDIGRQLGRSGAQIIADPTWDWKAVYVKHSHIARFRAIENNYSIIRATHGGLSQLIDPCGRIIKQHLVLEQPEQALIDKLPLGKSKTFYARFGDVFVFLNIIGLIVIFITSFKKKNSDDCYARRV